MIFAKRTAVSAIELTITLFTLLLLSLGVVNLLGFLLALSLRPPQQQVHARRQLEAEKLVSEQL
jgi:hypothetical protein